MRTEQEVRELLGLIAEADGYDAAGIEAVLRWVLGEEVVEAWMAVLIHHRELL